MTRIARFLLTALVWLIPAPSAAADLPEPIVEVDFDTSQTIPGQFLPLRVTVLVPTWMPQPVVFPPLDAPNLRVRLPDRSTSPTSKRIDGEEWSGVSRRYLVSPMVPGWFTLPGGQVDITYADPDNTAVPLKASIKLDPLAIEGVVPEGAENLDPFLAATDLALSQELPEQTTDLKPGDSLRRTVTATITGASPMMVPQLMPPPQIGGFAAYADEPVLEESQDRGVLSGSRKEVITLMVQSNGAGELPPIELSWYNIETGKIETASLDPVRISASGAPAADQNLLARLNTRSLLALLAVAGFSILLLVFAWPRLAEHVRRRRQRFLAGKAHARKDLLTAIGRQDYPATVAALQTWAERPPRLYPAERQTVLDALRPLSSHRYGKSREKTETHAWTSLEKAVSRAGTGRQCAGGKTGLPVLNP